MLTLRPVSLAEANAFVAEHHRHHKPVRGHKFSLGCMVNHHLHFGYGEWREPPGGGLEMRRPGRRQDVDRETPPF